MYIRMYVYSVLLQTPSYHSLTVFKTLNAAYKFIQSDIQNKDFELQSLEFVANEICDRSAMYGAVPIRVAWNPDKTCTVSICKAEVHEDHAGSVIHSLFDRLS